MTRGFYTILAAQFFSALADNALLFAAIALLAQIKAPDWQTPVLQQFFVFAYIVLAPFVGPFADSLPKGRVMFISNAVKFTGCLAMLLGLHPLYAYGIVGIGAAMYSPAKYGILTEYLPADQLVKANGWMEGSDGRSDHPRGHHRAASWSGHTWRPGCSAVSVGLAATTGVNTAAEVAMV